MATASPTATRAVGSRARAGAGAGASRFRPEVEGLRAVAVLAVLGFHASVPHFSGGFVGVDVFFVISGFLITGLLAREVGSSGRISLTGFWARRLRRIVPPAAIVLGAVSVAGLFLLPELATLRLVRQVASALFYVANWQFIAEGKDYLAGGTADSPVLHYWSLAVEEQFYLLWPVLVMVGAWWSRWRAADLRRVLITSLSVITAGSLVCSIVMTTADPAWAYMATLSRAWQFGFGGLLALVLPEASGLSVLPRSARWSLMVAGVVGMALVLWSVLTYRESTPYPGWAALAPTVGACLVIAGGSASPSGWMLALPPVRLLGRWSYSWYLWHWPVLVFAATVLGTMSWQHKAAWTLASLPLAALTYAVVEQPISRSAVFAERMPSAAALGVLATVGALAVTLAVGTVAANALGSQRSEVNSATFAQVFGDQGQTANGGAVSPAPLDAKADVPDRPECIIDQSSSEQPECVFGVRGGIPVVLFGDSHAAQWLPAMQVIAKEHGWELTLASKSGCPVSDIAPRIGSGAIYSTAACVEWRREQIARIVEMQPELILFSSLGAYISQYEELRRDWSSALSELATSKAQLVYIRDTPTPPFDVAECVSGSIDNWSACAFPEQQQRDPVIDLGQRGTDLRVVDLNGYLCQDGICPAVRAGTLMYRDDSHLTATAVRLLTPAMQNALVAQGLL